MSNFPSYFLNFPNVNYIFTTYFLKFSNMFATYVYAVPKFISCSSITLRELYSAAAEIIGEETTYLLSTNFFMIGDKLVFNLCVHFCLLILGEIGPWCGKITSIWRKRCSRYHFFPLPFLEIIE